LQEDEEQEEANQCNRRENPETPVDSDGIQQFREEHDQYQIYQPLFNIHQTVEGKKKK
jgi:hypothetical protein